MRNKQSYSLFVAFAFALWAKLFIAPSAAAQEHSSWTVVAAVREALVRSPELRRAQEELKAAFLEEPFLLANTDPSFESSYHYEDDRSPRAMPFFQGSRSRMERSEAAIVGKTLLGTQVRLKLESQRIMNPTPVRVLDPSVDSRLGLEVRQSLLRYFWGRPDRARRSRARAAVKSAQARLHSAAAFATARAARAAIELHWSEAHRAVQKAAVEDAELLLSKHQDKRRYGLVEDSDVFQAQASLEARRIEFETANSQLQKSRHAFLAAVYRLGESREPSPVAAPPENLPAPPRSEDISRRPDMEFARAELWAAEWSERIERLDTLPDLSLNASYMAAGLATNYGRSLDDMGGFHHPIKSVGMSFAIPFGFRRERLTRRQAALRLAAARAELERVEQTAQREIRDARELLRLAQEHVAAGKRLLSLERQKLKAEELRYRQGRSSTDIIVRFQQDIRRAEDQLLRAHADEALALVEISLAAGTWLDAFPVEKIGD